MPRSTLPAGFIAPMLPTLVDVAPDGGEWIHEIKYDGYRTHHSRYPASVSQCLHA